MCGISGILNFDRGEGVDRELLKSMCDTLSHRGPDAEGFFVRRNIGLGHRRLSIIDLSTGDQPIFNEDRSVTIVFNGEIYNYRELREELTALGHTFKTNTDTEVIVHLYEERKEECLQSLNGMFSFAIWDAKEEKLFLARDRIGEKPLIYYTDGKKVVFASELKAVMKDSSISKDMDLDALDLYLSHGYIPSPHTIYKDVKKLPPGHYLTATQGRINLVQYWNVVYDYNYERSDEEDAERIMEILSSSVQMRLESDVPLGAFLSGGIDSSAVVALMSRANMRIKTFSIGFEEAQFNELKDARFIAEKFGTDHYEEIVRPDAIKLLSELVWYYDEPYADSSAIPTYYVSKLARRHVKVVLSGDGGDELFAGYLRYLDSDRDKCFLALPGFVRKQLLGTLGRMLPQGFTGKNYFRYIAKDAMERYRIKIGCFTDEAKKRLYSNDMRLLAGRRLEGSIAGNTKQLDIITQYLFMDSKTYLPDDILVKVDKASMANSLETRVPILDHRLIEYAATIPPEKKINSSGQKVIFKNALKRLLPARTFTKKKHGFGVPLDSWFRKELKEFAYETLLGKEAGQRDYFNMKQVRYLLDEHQKTDRDNSFQIWTLLCLELWHQKVKS